MNLGTTAVLDEVGSRIAYALFVNVISQNDADKVSIDKVFGKRQRRGDAAFSNLIGVIQLPQTEGFSVFQQAQKLSGKEESLENLVGILYILFQDILHIESKANGEPIRNTDRPKTLMQVAHSLGLEGLRQAAANLATIERNLRRNVPARLSLEALALDLAGSNRK